MKRLESVEVCKEEIDESLEVLRWVAKKMVKDTNFEKDELRVTNAVEIIDIFTNILIKHIRG